MMRNGVRIAHPAVVRRMWTSQKLRTGDSQRQQKHYRKRNDNDDDESRHDDDESRCRSTLDNADVSRRTIGLANKQQMEQNEVKQTRLRV